MRDCNFIFKKILSLIFQQWNYSNDVILKLFNCSSLLFWSFCVSLSWTYIVLNGLNKSRLIIGKQKPGKILINKSSVFFSWIRKWFHSWDMIRMFWYFHSCIELVKKSKHPFYEWNYTTHWISSIYAWTIKKPYSNFSSGSCLEHAQVNLYVIEFWVLPILYKILFIHAIYPSKKFWICKSKPFYGTSMVARRH